MGTVIRFNDQGRPWGILVLRPVLPATILGGSPPPGRRLGRRRWLVGALALALVASLLAVTPAVLRVLGPAPAGGDAAPAGDGIDSRLAATPLSFIENRGQVDGPVSYYVQGSTTSLYFAPDGVTYALGGASQRWAVKLDFVGANPVSPTGVDRAPGVVSYFGDGRSASQTAIPTYSSIAYTDLWPGIDMVYEGTGSRLKYSFVVHPGADPSQIRLAYRGAEGVALNGSGQLVVTTPVGGFTDDKPFTYQDIAGARVEVPSAYALERGGEAGATTFGVPVGAYDSTRELVIDPAGVAVDGSGAAYVVGYTTSQVGFASGGPDTTYGGGPFDGYVAKVTPGGSGFAYLSYVGGAGMDDAFAVAADGAGNAYVAGYSNSREDTFPTAVGPDLVLNQGPNPACWRFGECQDAFVVKISE